MTEIRDVPIIFWILGVFHSNLKFGTSQNNRENKEGTEKKNIYM